MQQDSVDIIIEQWRRERPDLNPEPMGVIGRISRIAHYLDQYIERELHQFGISSGEFDVLATLRRAGKPYQLTPTALFRSLMLSSGAMTNRIDRLERAHLVQRCPDPADRRGTLVQLTSQGVELIDRAVEAHLENERRLLTRLEVADQEQLIKVLKHLLNSFETTNQNEKTDVEQAAT
jgi:DNA-binding MarR family transcriptional regulator